VRVEGFAGTSRYVLRRRLGAGGMGVVFAAYDRARDSEVALKILQRLDPQGIFQIKREFRALAEVSHPNLVSLYELVSSGNAWFFTMELIDGVDFLSYVLDGARPEAPPPHGISSGEAQTLRLIPALDPQPVLERKAQVVEPPPPATLVLDVDRLRSVLRQLVEGVRAIHAAGKVHRDIKPTNVLVSGAGRAVLLDFGLVSHGVPVAGGEGPGVSTTGGTPEYMAPEQVLGIGGDAASDWYAVGAMLYEALVQRLPFEGSIGQILKQKLNQDPPDIRGLTPPGTEDLADLAMRLLARAPAERPLTGEVLRAAGARGDGTFIASSMSVEDEVSAGVGAAFVGRTEQLAALDAAWRAHAGRHAVAVTITGRSGMGKSALCRRFLAGLRAQQPEALVIEARCYERESVPHKALDGVVDALVAEIAALPAEAREAIPRTDVEALGRLFPSARRLSGELDGDGEDAALSDADARGLRRQAAEALRRLLGRFAQQRPLVIHIDDFQWSDVDSLPLLSRPLSGVACPAVLWLFSYRAEEAKHSEPITGLTEILSLSGPAVGVHRVAVEPLTPAESSALALRLLGRADGSSRERADRLAQESSGSPLFVAELARLERERGDETRDARRPATLEELLKVRVAALPAAARRLLERVAVAGRPTRQGALRRAAGLGPDDFGALLALRNGNLVRASGVQEGDVVEAYHDRIRELVASTLAPEEARRCHADLAAALQAGVAVDSLPSGELEALAHHSLNAGDDEGALRFTLRVARGARDVYASRDAARHFGIALELLARAGDAETLQAVRREAAEAYRQAGLHDQALALLTVMLSAATDGPRAELFVDRGHVFQEKGDFQSAIADLESALELFGRRPPRDRVGLALAIGGELARHVLSSDRAPRAPAAEPGAAALERQAEVLILLVRIYYFVDIGKLLWAGTAAMNLARRSRREVTRVLASGYFGAILSGVGLLARAARHCQRAVALAERSGSGLALGVSLGRLGTVAIFRNELDRAVELLHRSVAALKPVSEVWELLTNLMLEATAHFLAGQLEPAERLWGEMSALARDAGGAMHVAWSQAWTPYVRYLRGAMGAAEARRELSAALEASRVVRDVANQTAAQAHLAALGVDESDAAAAADAAEALFETLRRYRVQVPFLQVGMVDAAEAALLALERGEGLDDARRRRLQRIVRGALARLTSVARRYPMLVGPTLRVRARALAFAGRPAQARRTIARAVEVLEGSPNRLWLFQACRDAARLLEHERSVHERRAAELGAALALDPRRWTARDGLREV